MAPLPLFVGEQLQAICDVLGDTGAGLTGSEIGRLLGQCRIEDPHPTLTKRHRLFEALQARQRLNRSGNIVARFILESMKPVSYVGQQPLFDERRASLNGVLAFCGLTVGEDGNLRKTDAVQTLSQAEERAGRLRSELQRRRVHADVLRFCHPELLQENYFHAVLEATKSVADKIRDKTGCTSDGARLVDDALGLGASGIPRLAFNSLRTENEISEHKGLANLLKGMFGIFRNPTAHAPKVTWSIDEQDALDLLTLSSLLHRRLDEAVTTGHDA